jgi:glycine/D-amino acid oxidase-like deaminating enzyme
VIVGATVEHAGFEAHDRAGFGRSSKGRPPSPHVLEGFPGCAVGLRPRGRRPADPGPVDDRPESDATGHFRSGVLLAPITAQLIASPVCSRIDADMAAFSPARFSDL